MSAVSSVSSAILGWYSALTVYSSSLTECSSSFVLCSSSFDAMSSSLVACSSSLLVSISSIVACRFSFAKRSSPSRFDTRSVIRSPRSEPTAGAATATCSGNTFGSSGIDQASSPRPLPWMAGPRRRPAADPSGS